ncbi:MAG: hypothetical protein Q8L65_13340, partial [Burkholderiales bacterium]|nr:hypothetical protein [Burkholderiales bacterium]
EQILRDRFAYARTRSRYYGHTVHIVFPEKSLPFPIIGAPDIDTAPQKTPMLCSDHHHDPGKPRIAGHPEPAQRSSIRRLRRSSKFGGLVMHFLLKLGYRGRIVPVHLRAKEVPGIPAVARVFRTRSRWSRCWLATRSPRNACTRSDS